ncbi:hypothetical protein [Streptomyces sp. NPDC054786]
MSASTVPHEAAAAEVPRPSLRARRAAHASALSATLGFIPLHAVWALGIPLWADEEKFSDWYALGGGPYLFVLSALALLAGVLALSLVRPWGLVFPNRLPLVGGRRVPRRTLAGTAYVASAVLLLYTAWAAVQLPLHFGDDGVFSPWIVVYGIPQFLVWGIGLLLAAQSYRARTAAVR